MVRVRAHVARRGADELQRSELIEKNERSDHLALWRRKHPSDEGVNIDGPGHNQCFDRIRPYCVRSLTGFSNGFQGMTVLLAESVAYTVDDLLSAIARNHGHLKTLPSAPGSHILSSLAETGSRTAASRSPGFQDAKPPRGRAYKSLRSALRARSRAMLSIRSPTVNFWLPGISRRSAGAKRGAEVRLDRGARGFALSTIEPFLKTLDQGDAPGPQRKEVKIQGVSVLATRKPRSSSGEVGGDPSRWAERRNVWKVEPGPAANDARLQSPLSMQGHRRRSIVVVVLAILGPLPYVADHVVEAKLIRR